MITKTFHSNHVLIGFFFSPATGNGGVSSRLSYVLLATDSISDRCPSRLPRGRGQKTADAGTSDMRPTTLHCNWSVIQTTQQGAQARAARVSVCTHYLREAVCYGLERDQVGSDWRRKWMKKKRKEIINNH